MKFQAGDIIFSKESRLFKPYIIIKVNFNFNYSLLHLNEGNYVITLTKDYTEHVFDLYSDILRESFWDLIMNTNKFQVGDIIKNKYINKNTYYLIIKTPWLLKKDYSVINLMDSEYYIFHSLNLSVDFIDNYDLVTDILRKSY